MISKSEHSLSHTEKLVATKLSSRRGKGSRCNNRLNLRFLIYIFFITLLLFPIVSFIVFGHVKSILDLSSNLNSTNLIEEFVSKESDSNRRRNESELRTEQWNAPLTPSKQQSSFQETPAKTKIGSKEGYDQESTKLAGLSCLAHGGPSDEIAREMVYWRDIPSDALFVSPLKKSLDDDTVVTSTSTKKQYLTFEPDQGGWNNIRMAMETVVGMAFAMGRTLVLPPESGMYLLGQKKHALHGQQQRDTFTFNHFFHMEAIHSEHKGLDIITMEEFLSTEALTGNMIDGETKKVSFPPNNLTDWNGKDKAELMDLWKWLRSVTLVPLHWNPEECLAVFPASKNESDLNELRRIRDEVLNDIPKFETYVDNPVPIGASPFERMKENWANRKDICLYDTRMQNAPYLHFPSDAEIDARLLVHFYAFLFFQNYKHDLWMKRFVRDHIRYIDEIQCAAARLVAKVRERARRRDPVHNAAGLFDAFHVRRGDFQYKKTRVEAQELLLMAKRKIEDGSSLYIATDEKSKSFFRPLMDHYHVMFMDDFIEEELHGINSNYFGMIDALVASRSRIFYGCWFSTFTGYINRLRGYHADKEKLPGYESGIVNSYFYALPDRFDHMQHYYPVKQVFYAREFPTAWRLIDSTVNETL